ncbi:unnamed protein product, partial [Polarella glacialis]
LVLGWCGFWVVGHYLFWALWNIQSALQLTLAPKPIDRYRKRLCRSQVYCVLAVVGGVHLLSRCGWNPHDLLYEFSSEHQLLFSMAAAHWIVSIWEDARNWTFLRGGLSTKDSSGLVDPNELLFRAYLVHHLIAGLGFWSVLRLKACTGICAFGLVFELPVLLMNHREFAVYANRPPAWFRDAKRVEQFWHNLQVMFAIGRGGPSLVYFYSVAYWWEDLSKLSSKESWTYHGMAIFFTILNYLLSCTFLAAWERKDLEVAMSSSEPDANFEDVFKELSEPTVEDEHKARQDALGGEVGAHALGEVSEEFFASKASIPDNEEGEVWIEVDDVAYDVTSFLSEHPGGAAVLRRYAGKDASQAFHKVKHSTQARMLMQKYCLGPISKAPSTYRIFEHNEALLMTFNLALKVAIMMQILCWLVTRAPLADLVPDVEANSGSAASLLIPGLGLAAGAGFTMLAPMLAMGLFRLSMLTSGTFSVSIAFSCFCVGLELARRPLPEALLSSAPTGVELGAGLILAVEEMLQICGPGGASHWRWRVLLGAFFAMLSWSVRGIGDLLDTAPGHGLAAVLLAASLPWLCRRACESRRKEVILGEVIAGLAFAGPMSAAVVFSLGSSSAGGTQQLVSEWWSHFSILAFVLFEAAAGTLIWFITMMQNNAHICTPAWSSRSLAVMLGIGCGLTGGFSWSRSIAWLAFYLHIGMLGSRELELMDAHEAKGTFEKVPLFKQGTRAMLDVFYMVWGTILFKAYRAARSLLVPFK